MRRRGFSMIELLVVVVLGAVTLGAAYRMLVVQQQAYSQEHARITVQQTGRTAIQLLSSELREISVDGADILRTAPDSLTVRVVRKLGVICDVHPSNKKISVWQFGAEPFATGDSILIFADGDTLTRADDDWGKAEVTGATSDACPATWDAGVAQRLDTPGITVLITDVEKGGPVRAYTTLTYGIYDVDGEWALGRHEPGGSVEVLLGGLAAPADGGLKFTYYDTTGVSVLPTDSAGRAAIERIEIQVRGQSRGRVGPDRDFYEDGLAMQLYLRNG